jgi:hypothetical protein
MYPYDDSRFSYMNQHGAPVDRRAILVGLYSIDVDLERCCRQA